MRLRDQIVLITGASRGIGEATALTLARRGAHVLLCARDLQRLEALRARIEAEGGRATAMVLDVTDPASVAAVVGRALREHGRIDVLINNAGNGGSLSWHLDAPAEATRDLFEVHLFGTERMTRAVLPSMLARGSGRVVNVVSTVGYVPMPGAAAYSAAKAAVIALTEALRGELEGSPVRLVLYSPPHTQTEAGQAWPLELPRKFSPQDAADGLLATLERDRADWLAGGNGSLLWLQRLSPALAARIMGDIGRKATRLTLGGAPGGSP